MKHRADSLRQQCYMSWTVAMVTNAVTNTGTKRVPGRLSSSTLAGFLIEYYDIKAKLLAPDYCYSQEQYSTRRRLPGKLSFPLRILLDWQQFHNNYTKQRKTVQRSRLFSSQRTSHVVGYKFTYFSTRFIVQISEIAIFGCFLYRIILELINIVKSSSWLESELRRVEIYLIYNRMWVRKLQTVWSSKGINESKYTNLWCSVSLCIMQRLGHSQHMHKQSWARLKWTA